MPVETPTTLSRDHAHFIRRPGNVESILGKRKAEQSLLPATKKSPPLLTDLESPPSDDESLRRPLPPDTYDSDSDHNEYAITEGGGQGQVSVGKLP